jgi:hypothetical protein
MEYLKILLLATGFIGIAILGFALNMLVKKNGRFPETSISKNKALRDKGITCVKHDELKSCGHTGGGCCGGT